MNALSCRTPVFSAKGDTQLVHALAKRAGVNAQNLCRTDAEFGVAYGGDEFVVVLPGLDRAAALKKAGQIRFRMKETVYLSSAGHALGMRASFGIATFPMTLLI